MQHPLTPSRRFRDKLIAACCGLLASGAAGANPQGPSVAAGQASFANPGPKMLEISNSPGAVINWNSFSIGAGETTRFVQQNAASAVLNRVTSNASSQLLGQLASNGRVFLINPAGILVGRDAVIDTAGLVLSTLDMNNDDFRRGVLKFADGGKAAGITNHGYIKTAPGGETLLIAPSITNAPEAGNDKSGLIENPDGKLLLAAGHSISITSLDHPDITFDVSAPDGQVINLGKLVVNGGTAGVLAATIKHAGMISADSLGVDGAGRVVLMASKSIETTADSAITARGAANGAGGTVDLVARAPVPPDPGPAAAVAAAPAAAPAPTAIHQAGAIDVTGGQGGTAHVEADTVVVAGTLDASGVSAGGRVAVLGTNVTTSAATLSANAQTGPAGAVRVGGDFHGAAGTRTASTTTIDAGTQLHADAGDNGDGGTVVVWSDVTTDFYGLASARGGSSAGNGGQIEVSGKDLLGFHGAVDVGAPQGDPGSLLLDPGRIIIVPGGTSGALVDPTPFPNDHFGSFSYFRVLQNGNLLLVNQNAGNTGVTAAGELYVFDTNGNYVGGVAGTAMNERLGSAGVWDLYNGRLLVQDPNASNGAITKAGAVIVLDGSSGKEIGRTYGRSGNELFGSNVVSPTSGNGLWYRYAAPNENLLVRSTLADVGGIVDAGAVVMVSAATGLALGEVTGNAAGEQIGALINFGIGAAHNYVIRSTGHSAGTGTVILASSTTGAEIGHVSGAAAGEGFGSLVDFGVVPNGNYVVRSPTATVGGAAGAGTVVLVDANTGTEKGRVSGNTAGEGFGSVVRYGVGVASNYVVQSQYEDVGGLSQAGAVVLANGATGLELGRVSGTTASEHFGQYVDYGFGAAGNYVIRSPTATIGGMADAGTALLVDATSGTALGHTDGLAAGDALGTYAPTVLANGNYVLRVPDANGGATGGKGSIVLVDGINGDRLGSYDGDTAGEHLGLYDLALDGFVAGSSVVDFTSLGGSDFLVYSPQHGGGAGVVAQLEDTASAGSIVVRGAVSGQTGSTDAVGDQEAFFLPNGNYIVTAQNYANLTQPLVGTVSGAGAVFVVDKTTAAPLVTLQGNSLNEHFGSGLDTSFFASYCCSNEFLITSATHGNTLNPSGSDNAGGIWLVDGIAGTFGSFIGNPGDQVGSVPLLHAAAGGVIVPVPLATPGMGLTQAGSVYLLDSATAAIKGHVDGVQAYEQLGSGTIDTYSLGSGNYLIMSPTRTVGSNTNAGVVLLVDGSTGTQLGGVYGTSTNEDLGGSSTWIQPLYSGGPGNYLVMSPLADGVAGADTGAAILAGGTTGNEIGRLEGATAGERLGSITQIYERSNGNYFVTSARAAPGGLGNAGSVYLADGTTGAALGHADGTATGEAFGNVVNTGLTGSDDLFVFSQYHTTAGGSNAGTVVQLAATDLGGGNIVRGRIDGQSAGERLGSLGTYGTAASLYYTANRLVVKSPQASPGGLSGAGTLYFYDPSAAAIVGQLNGTSAGEGLGNGSWVERTNGNLFIPSTNASPGGVSGAGAFLLATGSGALIGRLDGNHVNEHLGSNVNYYAVPNTALVTAALHDNGALGAAGGIFAVADSDLGGGSILRGQLLGNAANEQLGQYGMSFAGGNALIRSPNAANGSTAGAGALILANATTLAEIARLSGASANEHLGLYGPYNVNSTSFFLQSPDASVGGLAQAGSVLLVNSTNLALIGRTDGTTARERFGLDLRRFAGHYFVVSPDEDAGALTKAGAIVQLDTATGLATQRVTGISANERFGSDPGYNGWRLLSDGRILVPSINADVNGVTGAGRIVMIDPQGGVGSASGTGANVLFADNPSADYVITNLQIEALLNSGADLVLQANNDILSTLGAAISAQKGSLTLQAGRSIVLNAPIDVPTLKLVAHESAANGVLTQYTGSGSGDVVVDATQITAGSLDVSAQVLQVRASQDPLAPALGIATSSPQFFLDFLSATNRQAGGAAFMLGGDLLRVSSEGVVLTGGPAAGAFAALASAGDLTVNTGSLAMTAGTGENADAAILGLGGVADVSYKTCTGCRLLDSDPFLSGKSETGIYINVVRSPAIDAIMSMLGKDQEREDARRKRDKDKEKDKEAGSPDCAVK